MKHEKLPSIKSALATEELGAEQLVYDPATEKAHCLSGLTRTVFRACLAGETFGQLEEGLQPDEVAMIEPALAQLSELGLLQSEPEEMGRRKFLSAAGAMAALPLVASVLAPKPAQAVSCRDCTTIGLFGPPQDCTDCGKPCPAGAACNAAETCCFEYRLITTNGNGSTCFSNELLGAFGCRNAATQGGFNCDCGLARGQAIAFANTTGTLYYCCTCAASAPNSCATCG